MSDNILRQIRQESHAQWYQQNTAIIESAQIPFKWAGKQKVTMLFREENKPKVDFYPHTGRWRVAGVKKTFRGGAKSFIQWYQKQSIQG
ncbi:hypothetical protein [Coleofasciculus sp. E2-BRE-01]|jgi:hypothetical protein|uniref:hypothetical protein n=1 Tax=unclassified Coleofasciculus TaxID=2692782 RepID=UPI0032F0F8F3